MEIYIEDKLNMYSRDLRRLFIELVNQTLFHCPRKSPLDTFKLHYFYIDMEHFRRSVNSWLKFAISCNPKELYLWVPTLLTFTFPDQEEEEEEEVDDYDVYETPYLLQVSSLASSSITVLDLNGCNISCPSNLLLRSVRELHMTEVVGDIQQLIASCVSLEVLSVRIKMLSNLQSLAIVSPKLKHCHLQNLPANGDYSEMISFGMDAPELESIHFNNLVAKNFFFRSASPLAVAVVCWTRWWDLNLLRFIKGVKRLDIRNMWTRAQFAESDVGGNSSYGETHVLPSKSHGEVRFGDAVLSRTFAFHSLEHLTLRTGYEKNDILGLEIILSKCPLLVTLVLINNNRSRFLDEGEGDDVIVLDIPHLRLVKMKQFRESWGEMKVVRLLKKHGLVLEKIVSYPAEESEPPSVL